MVPPRQVEEELAALGLSQEASAGIIAATGIANLGDLEGLLDADDAAVAELRELFALAEGYGFADYLQLDTSCVRGLAYYTGACARVLPDHSLLSSAASYLHPSCRVSILASAAGGEGSRFTSRQQPDRCVVLKWLVIA